MAKQSSEDNGGTKPQPMKAQAENGSSQPATNPERKVDNYCSIVDLTLAHMADPITTRFPKSY